MDKRGQNKTTGNKKNYLIEHEEFYGGKSHQAKRHSCRMY